TLRAVPRTRRLIAVIGAGGDRDRGKRPRMGEVTARLADVVIVTDDNPRTEDPSRIRSEVLSGIAEHSKAEVREVSGRGEAIVAAARLADVGDTILLAGTEATPTPTMPTEDADHARDHSPGDRRDHRRPTGGWRDR